jgi:molybdopterin converting factor small subunit
MISVSVRYHNMLRQLTGLQQETVRLSEPTLSALLEHLAEAHGSSLRTMIFDPEGQVSTHLVVFRNQQLVPRGQGDLSLADGDELMLFPAISGG